MARNANGTETQQASAPATNGSIFSFAHGSKEVVVPRLLLIFSVLALTIIGVVMVFSSSTIEAMDSGESIMSYMLSQLVYALLGIAVCVFVARFLPYYVWLGRLLDVFWFVSVAMLVLTAFVGTSSLGAQRWLVIGPVHFQPSEIAKVAFILIMARIMYQARTENLDMNTMGIRIGLFVVAPLLLLYFAQSDLGTTVICAVGLITVLWLADVPMGPFFLSVAILVILAFVAVFFVGYRSDRLIFLDPESDYYGDGYQLSRSFYAFGEGGLFGVGLGNSTEKYLYLPEAETDFIFSIIGEELGLVGALAVVALFVLLLYAGISIARQAPDKFGAMIAGGCTAMLVFQAFLNIGCVIGLLPTTGKPLPFISSGGSSLLGSFLLVGVILSVSLASGSDSGIYRRRREDFQVLSGGESRRLGSYASSDSRDVSPSRSKGRGSAARSGRRDVVRIHSGRR